MARYYWTQQNLALLREAWLKGGIRVSRPLFPELNDEQIRSAARRHDIRCVVHRPHQRQELTPWIEAALRREYRKGNKPALKSLAKQLNVRYGWLKSQAQKLGLARPVRGPGWTAEEDKILERGLSDGYAPQTISRRLVSAGFNRSPAAVINRKETLNWRVNRESLTLRDLAALFNVDGKTIRRWIARKWLPARRGIAFYAGDNHEPDPDKQHWAVDYRYLRKFMLRYPHEWDHRRMRQEVLLDILCGANWSYGKEYTKNQSDEVEHG